MTPNRDLRSIETATTLAFVVVALLLVRYQVRLLDYIEWGDESETIVAAKMMAAGMSLYSEVFNHHGPLTFLTGYALESLGSFGIQGHRIPILVFQWGALAAIHFSPMLPGLAMRNAYTAAAATGLVAFMPDMYSHTYQYQPLAGLMLVVVLAQYTLPAIAMPHTVGPKRAALGNVMLASMPFLAVSYVPLAGLLFLASLRPEWARRAIAWSAAAVAANVAFLVAVGSVAGFLAFHIYLNAVYNGGHSVLQFIATAYAAVTERPVGFLAGAMVLGSAATLAGCARGGWWRGLLLAMAMASLLIRGGSMVHQVAFYYGCLALPLAFFLYRVAAVAPWQPAVFTLAVMLACAARLSLVTAADQQRLASQPIPRTTEFAQLARAVTGPDERIIAYSFGNYQYIAADRLPASGYFFLLPWQVKYNEDPRYGIRIDHCAQIRAARPKVMQVDKWKVWDVFPWETYGGCVQAILDEQYYAMEGKPYYLRKDLAPHDVGIAAPGEKYQLAPSAPLAAGASIAIATTATHRADPRALTSIGILFGTHARRNEGQAELRLAGDGGQAAAVRVDLATLEDNRYRFFDVPPGRYDRGVLAGLNGGGASAWESRGGPQPPATCIVYQYANGKRRFTPGCPLPS